LPAVITVTKYGVADCDNGVKYAVLYNLENYTIDNIYISIHRNNNVNPNICTFLDIEYNIFDKNLLLGIMSNI